MVRLTTTLFGLALMVSTFSLANADEKKENAKLPTGTWLRESNGIELKIEFVDKDTFKLTAFSGDNGVVTTNKFKFEKDIVKATITKVEEKGNFPSKPPVGLEYSFKWSVKKDIANLEDLKGEGIEEAKGVLEGEYEAKKEKK